MNPFETNLRTVSINLIRIESYMKTVQSIMSGENSFQTAIILNGHTDTVDMCQPDIVALQVD